MKLAHGTIVLALDGEKMLLFRNEGDRKYTVLETLGRDDLVNPSTREQGSDAPGRAFSSSSDRRSAYREVDWHRQAEERFACECMKRLERLAGQADGDIVVVAPPRTLGVMRGRWSKTIEPRIVAEIAKDLVHHETDDIARAIAKH
jgi:protein required for attachment to host cells